MSEITFTRTSIRPSVNTPWFQTPTSVLDHINSIYRLRDGDLLKTEIMLSDDQLTMSLINTWTTADAHTACLADPVIAANIAAMDAYNAQHNIQVILG